MLIGTITDVGGVFYPREVPISDMALLVNAHTIANHMAAQHPHLLALLFDPIAIGRRGEVINCTKPIMRMNVLNSIKKFKSN